MIMAASRPSILITCSGLGSRLGDVTKYTNKSLVRVSSKPAISHIIESYPQSSRFVITLGHFGDHVKQFIEIAYPNLDVTFVWVDPYEGPGASLGVSMFRAHEHLQCPFVYHACDTLTDDVESFNDFTNTLWVHAKSETSQYRTVRHVADKAKIILDKGEAECDPAYIGKCHISDYKLFWSSLQGIIESSKTEISDCHVINSMIKSGAKFRVRYAHNWFDMGNLDSLKVVRQHYQTDANILDKPTESTFLLGDKVIKFFSNEDILAKRVIRSGILSPYIPELVTNTQNFMSYRFVEGQVLSRFKEFSPTVLKNLFRWMNESVWELDYYCEYPGFEKMCYDFYHAKTRDRVNQFLNQRNDDDRCHTINGELVDTVAVLLERFSSLGISTGIPSNFHGDFILENIVMKNDGQFCLIDWRQDFAGSTEIGDVYYDLAKMLHNVEVNHDIVRRNLFTCEFESHDRVTTDILCSSRLMETSRIIAEFCREHGMSYSKVKVLTSIVWLNMSPLHDKDFGDFLFYHGKLRLKRALDEFEFS